MSKPRSRRASQRIRIDDVARAAGVSPMTVSRALRDPSKVSEAMRQRVTATVERIGYVPNRIAGNLSSNRSDAVALILPSLRNSLFANTVQGISNVLRDAGFHLMIADSGYGLHQEEALIEAFLRQRVCGMILHNTTHTARTRRLIERGGVPVVEVGNLAPRPLDATVSYSNAAAAKAMTLHLARLGYRRIGFVTLPLKDNERSVERRKGYLAAVEELGLAPDPRLLLELPGGFAAGAEAIERLTGNAAGVDAVFFAGDVLAVGAVFECQRRRLAIPDEVAIASFDDLEILRHVVPAVTSVRIPRYDIGRRGAEVLLDRVLGRTAESVVVDLKFEIIQRAST